MSPRGGLRVVPDVALGWGIAPVGVVDSRPFPGGVFISC